MLTSKLKFVFKQEMFFHSNENGIRESEQRVLNERETFKHMA